MSEPLDYEAQEIAAGMGAPPAMAPPPPPRGAMLAIFLIVLSDLLGFGLIIPALPFYARAFHASAIQIGFIFASYSFCQLIASPVLGLASDRWGRRPVLIFSQLGSVIGYMILALATSRSWANPLFGLALVYTSRVIDGFSGGNISTAQAYVSDVTPPKERAKGMGMLGAAFGIGFSIGPGIGGLLAAVHPSLPALGAALFSFVAAILTIVRLKEPVRHSHAVDDQTLAWLHPSKFKPILQNGALVQLLGISFLSMAAFVMLESTFAIFMADRFQFTSLGVGGLFALAGVVIIIVQGGLIGRLNKRFGEWPLVIAGPLFVATAMFLYAFIGARSLIGFSIGITIVIIAGLFNASGRSIQTPTLSSLVSQTTDPRLQGTTFGLFHMLGSMARVIGPVIATAVYTRHITGPFALAGAIMVAVATWTTALRTTVNARSARREVSSGVGVSPAHLRAASVAGAPAGGEDAHATE